MRLAVYPPPPRLKRPACKEGVRLSTDMVEPDGSFSAGLYPFANLGRGGRAALGDGVPLVAAERRA